MPEITIENILLELKKPIQGDGVYSIGYLHRAFNITETDINGRRKQLSTEVLSLIEDGLIVVPDISKKGIINDIETHGDMYAFMQISFNSAPLRVSGSGDLWLNQHQMSREMQGVRQSVDNLTTTNRTSENNVREAIRNLDKRSLAIGITIIILTAIGIIVTYLHL